MAGKNKKARDPKLLILSPSFKLGYCFAEASLCFPGLVCNSSPSHFLRVFSFEDESCSQSPLPLIICYLQQIQSLDQRHWAQTKRSKVNFP